ncbi:hypothetical protein GN156_27980, partial [bacterium LRH843]|nr:hypothetical protein [bacterium LRH843]
TAGCVPFGFAVAQKPDCGVIGHGGLLVRNRGDTKQAERKEGGLPVTYISIILELWKM